MVSVAGAAPKLLRSATRDEEVRHLLGLYDRDAAKIMLRVDAQFSILSARALTQLDAK